MIVIAEEKPAACGQTNFTIRTMPEQVVLYKIIRGNYAKAGMDKYLYENSFNRIDAPMETIVSGANTGDYSQMRSEIIMPVVKRGEECSAK